MHASSGVARSLFLRLHQNPDLVIERIVLNSKEALKSQAIFKEWRRSWRPAPQLLAVTPDYADRQGFAHPIAFFHSHPILETRQRRLGGQVATFDRIPIQ